MSLQIGKILERKAHGRVELQKGLENGKRGGRKKEKQKSLIKSYAPEVEREGVKTESRAIRGTGSAGTGQAGKIQVKGLAIR